MLDILYAIITLWWGFFFYGQALQAWHRLGVLARISIVPPVLVFAVQDITINVFIGSLMFWQLPFQNHCITFSQRLCWWVHEPLSFRVQMAKDIGHLLNEVVPNHIT